LSDTATDTVTSTIPTGNADSIAISPGGATLYTVGGSTSEVTVIDTAKA